MNSKKQRQAENEINPVTGKPVCLERGDQEFEGAVADETQQEADIESEPENEDSDAEEDEEAKTD